MDKINMKNMVVLKDLPSNIVEEAIVVLKNNKKINNFQLAKNKKQEKSEVIIENKQDKKYIVKEAEMVITNYIKELENPIKQKHNQNKLQKKYNKLKIVNRILAFFCFISIIAYLIK